MEANLQTRLIEIVAELDKKAEENVAIINKLISPVIPMSRDDIHMRTMLVTSDEVTALLADLDASYLLASERYRSTRDNMIAVFSSGRNP